ncbi:unnamed protein product [Paramecium sonneborni]|uniref:Myb-like domain-containing protein n=1 Tax=Paramecium sonneborni TaxID=65129 RepID=A0A8S1PBK7_9CILI|nr:unnamed protein product [Paramecium sonneborni]CAD8100528.1 unnamed protein product [Paramecium sonneborni]
MISDILYNPYCSTAYYFPQFLNYQQQLVQYMIFQQQNVLVQSPQFKYDSRIQPLNFFINYQQEAPQINNTNQNNHLIEEKLGIQEKCSLSEEDSITRANGHWTKLEQQQYMEFVQSHQSILKSKYDKKSKKIFKLMSSFIPTRTATQCRSHHQKFNPLKKEKKKLKQVFRQVPTVIIPQS